MNKAMGYVLIAALGYVAYEMLVGGQSLGTALTFGGVLPHIPGVTGLGCSCQKPNTGFGSIYNTGIYGGYAPTSSASLPSRSERSYNQGY